MQIITGSNSFRYHLNRCIQFNGIDVTNLLRACLSFSIRSSDKEKVKRKLKKLFINELYKSIQEYSSGKNGFFGKQLTNFYSFENFDILTEDGLRDFRMLCNYSSQFEPIEKRMKTEFLEIPVIQSHLSDILIFRINRVVGLFQLWQLFTFQRQTYKILGWTTKCSTGKIVGNILSTSINGDMIITMTVKGVEESLRYGEYVEIHDCNLQFLYLEKINFSLANYPR